MGRSKRWTETDCVDGVVDVYISDWKNFSSYIQEEMLDYTGYIWRGQASHKWLLESTLSRTTKHKKSFDENVLLERFKYAARGRRGKNPRVIVDDNEWWAIGQHYGLSTPLLDWTESPFVAAYFSYFSELNESEKTDNYRVVYALQQGSIMEKCILERIKSEDFKNLEFISPLTDDNARLVNQRGLFLKLPRKVDLEAWIRKNFKGEKNFILMKIHLLEKHREGALAQLNRMNVNHQTLFPDLQGASEYINMGVNIESYYNS